MKYGLSSEIISDIKAIFLKHPKIEKVVLYGSRAKGTYQEGSDIDLTLVGDDLELTDLYAVDDDLDSLNLPYTIDLSLYGQIANEGLIGHIERRGEVFYRKAKASGTWEDRKLGDFCEVIAGQSPEGKYYNDIGEGIPFYQGKKEFGLKYIGSPAKWTKKVTKEASSGDILMSVRAPVGPINFSTQNICIGRGLAAIRPSDKLDKEFLFYYLLSKQDEIKGNEGAVFSSINKSQIEQLRFSYVEINEQKRTVAILDQAFADIEKARANAEQNLKNACELFESYLNSRLLGVCSNKPEQTLSCVTEIIVDCEHKTAPTQNEGFPSIRTPNIGKGKLLLDGVRRVSEKTYNLWTKRAVPQYGDLILAREAPAGNVGVIPKGENVCLGQRTVLIRPKAETVNSKYLAFLLLHPIMQERLLSHSTGATVQHVNMKDIRKLSISKLPSMDEQMNDVKVLEETQSKVVHLENIYSKKLKTLDELKKSILQKAFTGELTKEASQ